MLCLHYAMKSIFIWRFPGGEQQETNRAIEKHGQKLHYEPSFKAAKGLPDLSMTKAFWVMSLTQ